MGKEDHRVILILFSPYEYKLTVYTYKYFVLDYNKQLTHTCCIKLFWADCITVLLDIIDRYLIIVTVNLKARGFTEFTGLTLLLHVHVYHKIIGCAQLRELVSRKG